MNEQAFVPLFRAVARLEMPAAEREKVLGNYLFMFEENGVFAFKHIFTHQYVHLDDQGGLQGGILNTGDFPTMGKKTDSETDESIN